jgi:hypothetical protein
MNLGGGEPSDDPGAVAAGPNDDNDSFRALRTSPRTDRTPVAPAVTVQNPVVLTPIRRTVPVAHFGGDIAHWPFNGSVLDLAGNSAFARPAQIPVFAFDGPNGQRRSLTFEKGQFIQAAGDSKLNITGGFAIHGWIKTRSLVADIVSKYDVHGGQRAFVFGLGGEGDKACRPGHLFGWVSLTAGSWQGIEIYGSRAVNDGQWHHVAFVFEPYKRVELRVDGVVDRSAQKKGEVPSGVAASKRDLVIGAGYRGSAKPNAYFFEGQMADLRIGSKLD